MTACLLAPAAARTAAGASRAAGLFVEDSVEDVGAAPPAGLPGQAEAAQEDAARPAGVAVGVGPAVATAADVPGGRRQDVEAVAQGGEPLPTQVLVHFRHLVVGSAVLARQLVQDLKNNPQGF